MIQRVMAADSFKEFVLDQLSAGPELYYLFERTAILRWIKKARTASWLSIAPTS